MAESFRGLIIAFIIAALFVVVMIGFSVNFQVDNNTNVSVIDNALVNETYVNLQGSLNDLQDDANAQQNATERDPVLIGLDSLILTSIWGTIKIFASFPRIAGSYLLNFIYILGVPVVVLGTIMAIIIITLIFWGYKTIRTGQ